MVCTQNMKKGELIKLLGTYPHFHTMLMVFGLLFNQVTKLVFFLSLSVLVLVNMMRRSRVKRRGYAHKT
jgi:hypothetical protein